VGRRCILRKTLVPGAPVALSELAHERKYCTGHEA
jgi:hypothetical protein